MSSSINLHLNRAPFSSISLSLSPSLLFPSPWCTCRGLHLVSIMVAAALVSHRSLPPVSLLLFLFSFPFSVWLFGLRRVVCFFSHSHFFSSFLNSLTLSARRHEAELEFTTIAASLPAHCCRSLASFSGHFSFCHFFYFFPSVPSICLERLPLPLPFQSGTAGKSRKSDAGWHTRIPYRRMHTHAHWLSSPTVNVPCEHTLLSSDQRL